MLINIECIASDYILRVTIIPKFKLEWSYKTYFSNFLEMCWYLK